MKHPVLLLGLFDTAIMTARCFQKSGVIVYGMDYEKKHLGFFSNRIKAIKAPDPNLNEDEWLDFVLNWLKKAEQIFVVIPTSDLFVQLYAKYQNKFSKYCLALIPDKITINKIIERDQQFNSAIDSGIRVPEFIVDENNTTSSDLSALKFPVAIKPLDSPQWKKVFNNKGFVIEDDKSLAEVLLKLSKTNVKYLIQRIIEGDNTNNFEVNSLLLPDGKIIQHSTRKIRQYPDRFGTATCIEFCATPEIEKLAETYIRNMNIVGFSNIEFKLNSDDNQFYYIETNPRVWLQVNFSMRLGINFPMLYYNHLTGNKVSFEKINIGKGKWVDFLPDLLFWIKYRTKYNLSLVAFFKTWFPLISTSLISIKDPIPFLKDLNISKKIKNIFLK